MSDGRARDGLTEAERERMQAVFAGWSTMPNGLLPTVERILADRAQRDTGWPCDDYRAPLTCYTTPRPKTIICEGCRAAFPSGPDVAHAYAQRDTGSWVCGRCGQSPEQHSKSECVYDPVFRSDDAGLAAAIEALVRAYDENRERHALLSDCGCSYKDCYECGKWCRCIHDPIEKVRALLSGDHKAALAERDRRVKAEALREAADELDDHTACTCEPGDHLTRMAGPRWLRARADRLSDGGAA